MLSDVTIQNKKLLPLSNQGKKLIVTNYALDYWTAQSYGIDLNNWPKQKPDHINKNVYENLRQQFKKYIKG